MNKIEAEAYTENSCQMGRELGGWVKKKEEVLSKKTYIVYM